MAAWRNQPHLPEPSEWLDGTSQADMARSRGVILGAILAFGLSGRAMAADGWGASWSFGPVRPTASNHIIYTKTTLVPGRLPTWPSGTGPLFIWPGLSNPTSDLVQTTADAWGDNASACGAKAGQWCLEASVFGSFGQRSGPSVAVDPDDHITIEYKLQSDNNTWLQTVTSQKLGKVVSTLTSTSGLMLGGGFGFATEADANSYTIDTQYYLCTEIHLAAADPQFGGTGVGAAGAQYGATGVGSGRGTAKNLRTPDNGLTWLVDLITLPAMQPQGTQTAAPAFDCGTSGSGGTGGAAGTRGTGGAAGRGRQRRSRWPGRKRLGRNARHGRWRGRRRRQCRPRWVQRRSGWGCFGRVDRDRRSLHHPWNGRWSRRRVWRHRRRDGWNRGEHRRVDGHWRQPNRWREYRRLWAATGQRPGGSSGCSCDVQDGSAAGTAGRCFCSASSSFGWLAAGAV